MGGETGARGRWDRASKHQTQMQRRYTFIIDRISIYYMKDEFFYSFGHNFHKILYGERKQLCKSYNALVNYPGVSEVKRSRSESVFNCSWTRCANTRCRTTTHCKQSEGHFGWIRSSAGCLTHHPASLALPLFSALPLQHSLQKKPCSAG